MGQRAPRRPRSAVSDFRSSGAGGCASTPPVLTVSWMASRQDSRPSSTTLSGQPSPACTKGAPSRRCPGGGGGRLSVLAQRIFGAVCPKEGKGAALIMPACNTEAMNLHLAEIAATVAPAAHAILLVDQAGWHLSTRLLVPANITIILLPPKCPELNPVENVWQFMRDNWLSNRIFKSYDDLVDHCCAAWNKLVDQPWRIMSIGLRQWAHGF